jgi:hypothetical protein
MAFTIGFLVGGFVAVIVLAILFAVSMKKHGW